MATHRITVEPEHRGGGRYTYNVYCLLCGQLRYGARSRAAAEHEGRKHQQEEARRG